MKYYESRFGPERVQSMVPKMKAVASENGIRMEYGGHVGNTLDSHRLIWKAREVGGLELQDKVVESLFKAYFEDSESLGEQSVLENCAARAGLAGSAEFLSDAGSPGLGEVRREMEEFGRAFRCTGVPMFVVDGGRAVLNGAQESDAFLGAFGRL